MWETKEIKMRATGSADVCVAVCIGQRRYGNANFYPTHGKGVRAGAQSSFVQMISASSPISKNPGGETKIDVSVGRVQRIQLGSPARRWRIKRFLCVCVSAGLFWFFF